MFKQRLELNWIGKHNDLKIEPRILIEDPTKSFGDKKTKNLLIHGDNLLALKALESDYAGKIKCCYIDPPYNTGGAFEHYDDGLEHSIWLSLMKPRIEIIRRLLSENGSLWISIDDDECHYLKVLCDEIFGRQNFVRDIVWQKKYAAANDAKGIPDAHDHILVYQKSNLFRRNLLPRTEKQNSLYKYDSKDGKGLWRPDNLSVKTYSKEYDYEIINPNTQKSYLPPSGRSWVTSKITVLDWIKEGRVFFGQKGNGAPQLKRYLNEVQNGIVATSWWTHEECGHNDEARKESKNLFSLHPFSTPKPEKLLQKIITLSTDPNDIVLDSFLGSGTTAAVAHKIGRHWIGIERGEHCYTHCLSRLKKVVSGEDQGGISKSLNWQGGGGFAFFELAPSLLQKDSHENWVISPTYNATQLIEAVCKHEGFKFWPDQRFYWKQGYSTEKDFIFITTEFLTVERVERIIETMKSDETLLICAKAFRVQSDKYPNITLKKIPQMLLGRCEFGRDDYSLNIQELVKNDTDANQIGVAES